SAPPYQKTDLGGPSRRADDKRAVHGPLRKCAFCGRQQRLAAQATARYGPDVREVLVIEVVNHADARDLMRGWNQQRRDGLGDDVAVHPSRLGRDEHVAILERQAVVHPRAEATVCLGMDMPEAWVDLGQCPSMFR